ncbi:MAG: bifunctional hydroxymethylpyrimidine kinase/phosphomethylpyrimidine kinase [Kiloniellales bacterium]|nr:bifunctional hydroxymethylpyrimidine kinase/phosphomethylpyrimidine kinase [Kiloniellales bacterium]
MKGRVLIVAGSDSGGGAGIQADIKTVTALGGFAATAVTALTAQNTTGVYGVVGVEPAFIQQQMRVVVEDIGADAVKTGMLHSAPVIEAVAEVLAELDPALPVVVDPVMVAQSGASLLESDAVSAVKERLLPRAGVLTPNLPEAAALLGGAISETRDGMVSAALGLAELGPGAVLLKGGHMASDSLRDVLVRRGEVLEVFEEPRIDTEHTHGTGCTLASAIATGLAQGLAVTAAVQRARRYLRLAIERNPGLGRGQGPVDHGVTVRPFDGA